VAASIVPAVVVPSQNSPDSRKSRLWVFGDSPCEQLLGRYRNYLPVERGLAASTIELNVRMVRPFLTDRRLMMASSKGSATLAWDEQLR
jgi:hypothetical protein